MNCPICNVTLVMSERQGIEIDYCPQCRGVWLDRGKLDKIIERSAPEQRPQSQFPPKDRYDRHHEKDHHGDHHDDYHHHKKKGFLRDLFD